MPDETDDLVGLLAGMGKRLGRTLVGLLLLCLGAYFVQRIAIGVRDVWQREHALSERASNTARRSNSDLNDPTDAARLTTYGFLAQQAGAGSEDPNTSPARPKRLSPMDHVHPPLKLTQLPLLHKRISLRSYRSFGFDVPPHAIRPRIQGYFRSLPADGKEQPEDTGSVEVMLMTEQEFRQLRQHEPGIVSFVTGGIEGSVNWTLPARPLQGQKYYLVFHNPLGGPSAKLIDAEFTVNFD